MHTPEEESPKPEKEQPPAQPLPATILQSLNVVGSEALGDDIRAKALGLVIWALGRANGPKWIGAEPMLDHIELKNLTYGGKPIGDWEISIRRIDD